MKIVSFQFYHLSCFNKIEVIKIIYDCIIFRMKRIFDDIDFSDLETDDVNKKIKIMHDKMLENIRQSNQPIDNIIEKLNKIIDDIEIVNNKAVNVSKETLDKIVKLCQCMKCSQFMNSSFKMCHSGHAICMNCYDKQLKNNRNCAYGLKCVICVRHFYMRNESLIADINIIEKVYDLFDIQTKCKVNGCNKLVLVRDLKRHALEHNGSSKCGLCDYTYDLDSISVIEHYIKEHGYSRLYLQYFNTKKRGYSFATKKIQPLSKYVNKISLPFNTYSSTNQPLRYINNQIDFDVKNVIIEKSEENCVILFSLSKSPQDNTYAKSLGYNKYHIKFEIIPLNKHIKISSHIWSLDGTNSSITINNENRKGEFNFIVDDISKSNLEVPYFHRYSDDFNYVVINIE